MTWQEAIRHGYRLHETWVSNDKKVDLHRVRASIRQEYEWASKSNRVSPGCLTEIRNDRKLVGQILKNYPDLFKREVSA